MFQARCFRISIHYHQIATEFSAKKEKKIKIVHLPFTWQLVKKRPVGVFYDSIFSFPSWKPVTAKKSKGRTRIFAVLAGPGEVASKIGKRWGVVLDSHSLH